MIFDCSYKYNIYDNNMQMILFFQRFLLSEVTIEYSGEVCLA